MVFENGLGGPLELWGKVQPDVSRFARTVSYDRAGAGLSDEGPPPRDGRRIAAELRAALRFAGIAPPACSPVGASLGGPYVRSSLVCSPTMWKGWCSSIRPPTGTGR